MLKLQYDKLYMNSIFNQTYAVKNKYKALRLVTEFEWNYLKGSMSDNCYGDLPYIRH